MADWPRPTSPSTPAGPVRSEVEVRNRDIERLQGLQMLLERVSGASIAKLAEKYDIPGAAVERTLTDIWKDGALARLEAQMYNTLVPLAMAVYEAQLRMGNENVARDVLSTVGVLKKQQTVTVKTNPDPNSLEAYRLARQQRAYKRATTRVIDVPS